MALIGPNGVGKSTLFKIIMGDESQDQGEYKLGQGVDIAYFHQEQKVSKSRKFNNRRGLG